MCFSAAFFKNHISIKLSDKKVFKVNGSNLAILKDVKYEVNQKIVRRKKRARFEKFYNLGETDTTTFEKFLLFCATIDCHENVILDSFWVPYLPKFLQIAAKMELEFATKKLAEYHGKVSKMNNAQKSLSELVTMGALMLNFKGVEKETEIIRAVMELVVFLNRLFNLPSPGYSLSSVKSRDVQFLSSYLHAFNFFVKLGPNDSSKLWIGLGKCIMDQVQLEKMYALFLSLPSRRFVGENL